MMRMYGFAWAALAVTLLFAGCTRVEGRPSALCGTFEVQNRDPCPELRERPAQGYSPDYGGVRPTGL